LQYTPVADDGSKVVWTFDATNTQPYTRYVDEDDAQGHLLIRSVLLDSGESWSATFQYDASGQVTTYEVGSFNAGGQLVGRGFFHADGTPV
jgi:hypothetical protein